jgi:hypothetical protein
VYTSNPFLWEVDKSALSPEDPVREVRSESCRVHFGQETLRSLICERASFGHPNEQGERTYADAIMSRIGEDFIKKNCIQQKVVKISMLDAKVVHLSRTGQEMVVPTEASFVIKTNNHLLNYPVDSTTSTKINTGSTITFPPDIAVTEYSSEFTAPYKDELHIEITMYKDGGEDLEPQSNDDLPSRPPLIQLLQSDLSTTIDQSYPESSNFGNGVYTVRSEPFVVGKSLFDRQTEYFEVTYRIETQDYVALCQTT